jgi:hypothetical protein
VALAAGAIRIDSTVVNREDLVRQLQTLDNLWEGLQSKSRHDDFSDLPQESLQSVMRAQTLVDRVTAGTTSAAETDRVREQKPHMRIPVLRAVLSQCAPRPRADAQHSHRLDPQGSASASVGHRAAGGPSAAR